MPPKKDSKAVVLTPAIPVRSPVDLRKDGSTRSISVEFLADLEKHYHEKGVAVLDHVLEHHPLEYFKALVNLSKVVRVEANVTHQDARKPQTIDEILAKVEEKVGPRGRLLFEKYLGSLQPLVGEEDKS